MIFLRSAAFNAFFFGVTFLLALGTLPLRAFAPQRAPGYLSAWARLMLGGLRLLCGIRYETSGLQHLPPDGPALVASMHQSAFDSLIWLVLAPRPAYVIKRELLRIPLVGPMLPLVGMIIVDRHGGGGAVRTLLREADRAVAERRQIVIFPEGTRVVPGVRAPLQPGVAAMAARTGLPVIPVATDSGLYWGRRAFYKRPGVIHVAVQPPLAPGLTREAVLEQLGEAFVAGAAQFGAAVDNSVGEPSAGLR